MKPDAYREMTSQLYSFAFNYLSDLVVEIECVQKEMELLYLDLEEAYEATGSAREEALAQVRASMKNMRLRRRYLLDRDRDMMDNVLDRTQRGKDFATSDLSKLMARSLLRHMENQES